MAFGSPWYVFISLEPRSTVISIRKLKRDKQFGLKIETGQYDALPDLLLPLGPLGVGSAQPPQSGRMYTACIW